MLEFIIRMTFAFALLVVSMAVMLNPSLGTPQVLIGIILCSVVAVVDPKNYVFPSKNNEE